MCWSQPLGESGNIGPGIRVSVASRYGGLDSDNLRPPAWCLPDLPQLDKRRAGQVKIPWPMSSEIVQCPACAKKNRVPASAAGFPHCGNCKKALPWIVDADDSSFRSVVDEAPLPVLVDLWAPWCGPCRMVSPALEEIAGKFAGRMKLVKVNVDDSPGVQQRFEVRGIPTLLLMKGAEVLGRQTGAAPEPQLRKWVESVLPPPGSGFSK